MLGFAATVGFGLLSLYLYLRSRRVKRPAFGAVQSILQTRRHPDVDILYQGQSIHDLRQLRVVFYNGGTEAIRKEDVSRNAFPRVEFESPARVLSLTVIKAPTEENYISVNLSSNSDVTVEFEYLNPGDGVVFEVLYDGCGEEGIPAFFRATLAGAKPVRARYITWYENGAARIIGDTVNAVTITLISFTVITIVKHILDKMYNLDSVLSDIYLISIGILITVLCIFFICLAKYKKHIPIPDFSKEYMLPFHSRPSVYHELRH